MGIMLGVRRHLALLGGLAALAINLIHGRAYIAIPQFYAEDGTCFFKAAYEDGLGSFLQTCGGYLHIYPRSVSIVAALLPLAWAPLVQVVGAFLAQVILVRFILSSRLKLTPTCRAIYCLAIPLVPNCGEILLNLTNCHWYLAPALIILLVGRAPTTCRALLIDCVWLLFLGLSGPFLVLFLLPLLALRALDGGAFGRLERTRWAVAVGLALFHVSQWNLAERTGRLNGHLNTHIEAWFAAFVNLAAPFALGLHVPRMQDTAPAGWGLLGLVVAGLVLGSVWLLRGQVSLSWRVGPVLCGLMIWCAALWEYRARPDMLDPYLACQHYFFVPYLVVAWLLADVATCAGLPRVPRVVAACVLAISGESGAAGFATLPHFIDYNYPRQLESLEKEGSAAIKIPPGWNFIIRRK